MVAFSSEKRNNECRWAKFGEEEGNSAKIQRGVKLEEDKLLSTRQAREILGVALSTIYDYIHSGLLKAHKLGGNGKSRRHWKIWHSDLIAFVENKLAGS
jgi:excisionase family DNA binding protein